MPQGKRKNAIYARYSSHNQDHGYSIEVQVEACQKLAGYEPLIYVDRAVTGTTMNRESFNEMIADAEAGKICKLYVYKFDRFGRSAHAHGVVADLESLGVHVVSVTEGDDPLTRGIQLVVSEDFSRRHGERVSDSKLKRFRDGHFHGGPVPFGYRVEDRRLVVEDDEAEIVRRVFSIFLGDSIGHKQIATQLTSEGITPRRSNRWSAGSVRRMLSNPLYVGRRRYRQYEYIDRPRRPGREPREIEEALDESLRIVDDVTFARTQDKLESRSHSQYTRHHQTRRFSKLLYCGCCDSTYIRRYSTDRPDYIQWGCGLRIRQGRHLCTNQRHVREHELVDLIDQSVAHVFERAGEMFYAAKAEARRLTASDRSRQKHIGAQITVVDKQLETLVGRLADPDLSEPVVKQLISNQIVEKTRQREELLSAQNEHEACLHADDAELDQAVWSAFSEARESLADVTTDSEYNAFVREWFGELRVNRDGTLAPRDQSVELPGVPNA